MACPRRPLKALYWSPYPSVRVLLKWTNLRPRSKLRHTLGGHTLPSLVDHKCSSSSLNNSLWYEHNNGKDFICPRAGISLAFAACAQISCIISVHLFHLYCSANASVDNVEMIAAEEGSRPSLSWLWLPVRCPCPPLIDHCCYLVVVMMRMMRMVMMIWLIDVIDILIVVVSDMTDWCDWRIDPGGFWYHLLMWLMYRPRWFLIWLIDMIVETP